MKNKIVIILLVITIFYLAILVNNNINLQNENKDIKNKIINNEINVFSDEILNNINTLEKTLISTEKELNNLELKYGMLIGIFDNNSYYIVNVPFTNQYPNYPTGCESVALTILLNYYGIKVTPNEIIDKLPKGKLPFIKNGIMYGGNPEIEFIGNPYSKYSYGVYDKPIESIANMYKQKINNATGLSLDEILKIVKTNNPVLVWTSMNLMMPYISKSWIYEPTGERIYWKAGEHAAIIIGYTKDKIIISDPIDGKIKYQSKIIFEDRYNYFGKRALYYNDK